MATAFKPGGVRDVPHGEFIAAYAKHLKGNDRIQLPSWVDLVKTGPLRELAPYDSDWYYVRAAAIARKVYMRQALGVGALRRQFGGRNERRGTVPEHFARASGGVIRHVLIQLEAIGIVEKAPGVKGGRRITAQGQRDLDLIAGRCERTVEPLGGAAPAAVAAGPDAAAEAEAE